VTVEVHVSGRIEGDRFAEFMEGARRWCGARRARGRSVPTLYRDTSGQMDSVLAVFRYPDLKDYEEEQAREILDREDAGVARELPFEGPLTFSIHRELEVCAPAPRPLESAEAVATIRDRLGLAWDESLLAVEECVQELESVPAPDVAFSGIS
jgi:hypothetical protein